MKNLVAAEQELSQIRVFEAETMSQNLAESVGGVAQPSTLH